MAIAAAVVATHFMKIYGVDVTIDHRHSFEQFFLRNMNMTFGSPMERFIRDKDNWTRLTPEEKLEWFHHGGEDIGLQKYLVRRGARAWFASDHHHPPRGEEDSREHFISHRDTSEDITRWHRMSPQKQMRWNLKAGKSLFMREQMRFRRFTMGQMWQQAQMK